MEESCAIELIRHEFAHRLVHEKNLEKYFPKDSRPYHGYAFKYACGLINAIPRSYTDAENYRKITPEEAEYYSKCEDIPDWNMEDVISRLKSGDLTVPHHANELTGLVFPPPSKIGNSAPQPIRPSGTAAPSVVPHPASHRSESGNPPPAPPQKNDHPISAPPQKNEKPSPAPPQKTEKPSPVPPQKTGNIHPELPRATPAPKTNEPSQKKRTERDRHFLAASIPISVILSVIAFLTALAQTYAPGTVPEALKGLDISLASMKFGWRALLTAIIIHAPSLIFLTFLLIDNFPVSEEARMPAVWIAGISCGVTLIVTSVFLCIFSELPTSATVLSIIIYFALEIYAAFSILAMNI